MLDVDVRTSTTATERQIAKTRPNKGEREMIMDVAAKGERDIPRGRLWSVEEVSYYLGVPVGTLYSWRCTAAARRVGGSAGSSAIGRRT